jgi:glycosyltransferase involved in cell wall biosynthesis
MKLLIVCSINSGRIAPFIQEQEMAIASHGVETDYFLVKQKGILGYLNERKNLISKIKSFQPDIIHAHYGLSGLLSNLQRKVPVVTTYHGSDINNASVFPFSLLCMILSAHNIFVSQKNRLKANGFLEILSKKNEKSSLIPCGTDIKLFLPIDKLQARKELSLDSNEKLVLFAGAFNNTIKNPELAKAAMALLPDTKLLELSGYSRHEVVLLMNAVDAVLMTSFTEGSPQFIKEAMACNCPIVSVPVGDVPDVIDNIEGCFLTTYNENDIALDIRKAIMFNNKTVGRKKIIELGLDAESVVKKILNVYLKCRN